MARKTKEPNLKKQKILKIVLKNIILTLIKKYVNIDVIYPYVFIVIDSRTLKLVLKLFKQSDYKIQKWKMYWIAKSIK